MQRTCIRSSKSDSRCLTTDKENITARANTTLTSYTDKRKKKNNANILKNISRLKRAWGKSNCKSLTASKEMRQELDSLKAQYTTVCEQESALRSQIALLTAEIVLMETNEYNRAPANVHKISFDPIYIRKVSKVKSNINFTRPEFVTRQMSKISKTQSRFEKIKKFPPVDAVLNQAVQKERRTPTGRNKTECCINNAYQSGKTVIHKINTKQVEENKLQYCPYCSLFCHPEPIIYPRVIANYSTACLTEFRLPKIKLKQVTLKNNKNCKIK